MATKIRMSELEKIKGIGRWRFDILSDERGKNKNHLPDFLKPRQPNLRLIVYVCGVPVEVIVKEEYNDESLLRHVNLLRVEVQREITRQATSLKDRKIVLQRTNNLKVLKVYNDGCDVFVGSFRRSKSFLLFEKK